MVNLSRLYKSTLKKDLKSKASYDYVRPTLGQHFVTHKDFNDIKKPKGLVVDIFKDNSCIFAVSFNGDFRDLVSGSNGIYKNWANNISLVEGRKDYFYGAKFSDPNGANALIYNGVNIPEQHVISMWVNCSVSSSGWLYGNSNGMRSVWFNEANIRFRSGVHNRSTSTSRGTPSGEWHHIVIDFFDFYINPINYWIDGIKYSSNSWASDKNRISSFTGPVLGHWYESDRGFNGKLADIRIFNRRLTEEEINILYNE